MDISSSLAGTKEFRIVKRGYDPDEVDAFLDQIALGVADLKRKLAEARERGAPAAPAAPGRADAGTEEIHRALILAQRAADEEIRKASEEGERLIAEARTRADELRQEVDAEVERRREEGRAGLEAEIRELQELREALTSDVVVLERHVEEQREVVQAAVGELQSLLDHPEAFRISAPSGVTPAPPPPAPPAAAPPSPEPAVPPPGRDGGEGADPVQDEAAPDDGDDLGDLAEKLDGGGPEDGPGRRDDLGDDDLDAGDPWPAVDDIEPGGPPTQAVEAVPGPVADADTDEDAFLAELRKAMVDEEPLGPRDDFGSSVYDDRSDARGRSRFGRRR